MKSVRLSDQQIIIAGLLILLFPIFVNMLEIGVRIPPVICNLCFAALALSNLNAAKVRNGTTTLVFLFILWSIFSVVLFVLPYNPADMFSFFVGIHIALIPAFAYFLAFRLTPDEVPDMIGKLVMLHACIAVISIVLHFTAPAFFTQHLQSELADLGYVDISQFYARLQGPLGSTSMGVLSCSSVFLIPMTRFPVARKAILISIFFVCAFLTFQRSSMLVMSFAVLLSLGAFSPLVRILFVICALLSLTTAISTYAETDLLSRILGRVGEIPDILLFEGRSGYGIVYNGLAKYMLGLGLGATTSIADGRGYNPGGQIVDANHMRIMADLGIVGLLLFLMAWVHPVLRAAVKWRHMPLVIAVTAYQLQALGTNVFDAYYTGHLYWFYLGLLAVASGSTPDDQRTKGGTRANPLTRVRPGHPIAGTERRSS